MLLTVGWWSVAGAYIHAINEEKNSRVWINGPYIQLVCDRKPQPGAYREYV